MRLPIARFIACFLIAISGSFSAFGAIVHVQDIGIGSLAAGGATSFSIPVSSTVSVGDLIVVEVAYSGATDHLDAESPTDSKGNTYARRGAGASFDETFETGDFVAIVTTALQPGDEITIPFSSTDSPNPTSAVAAAQEFSGASTDEDGNAGASGSSSTTSFNTSTFTTTNADDLLVAYVAVQSTASSGVNQITSTPVFTANNSVQANGLTIFPLYAIVSATGTYGLEGNILPASAPAQRFVSIHSLKAAAATSNANLTVSKTHVGNFTQGQQGATYTLTVTNTGSAAASGAATVVDTLPTGLSFGAAAGAGWTCSGAGQNVSCTNPALSLSPGGTALLTVTVNVAANAAAQVVNEASVNCTAPCTSSGNPAIDPTTITPLTLPPPPTQGTTVIATPALNLGGLCMLLLLIGAFALRRFRAFAKTMRPS